MKLGPLATWVLNDACSVPRFPKFFGPCRKVRIGKQLCPDRGWVPDRWTGKVGVVVEVYRDGDVLVSTPAGHAWIFHARLHPLDSDGTTRPSVDDLLRGAA